MAQDEKKKGKQAGRLTLAPLYLAAGLTVCYVVLTQLIPTFVSIADTKPGTEPAAPAGWQGLALELSTWVRANRGKTIGCFVAISFAGFVVPFLYPPARFLIWLAALAVFLLDVALAAGTYVSTIYDLIESANPR